MNKIYKKCKKCETLFLGSSHAWYCEDCKQKTLSKQRQKYIQRIKSKNVEGVCVICGKKFLSYTKKQTCSQDCELKLRAMSQTGKNKTAKTKEKIGDKNCIKWHIVSPYEDHYEFYNLEEWSRNNCKLFGFSENPNNARKIASGIRNAKSALLGISAATATTYKGWRVIIEYGPTEICYLYKNGWSVNKIHDISKVSASKIRKILINNDLWDNKLSKKIKQYLSDGKNQKEIADLLNVSVKVINSYAPYSKCIYNYKPSQNALNIKRCKDKNKSSPFSLDGKNFNLVDK